MMENNVIEKLDRLRYRLMLWLTISWSMWFGGYILKDHITNMLFLVIVLIIGLAGSIGFIIVYIKIMLFGKNVKSNKKISNALNDELMIYNRSRTYSVGFWTFIITISIFFAISIFTEISALLVCELTLFAGVLSTLISYLIINSKSNE